MARLDPVEGFDALKTRVTEAITGSFPQEGIKNVIELKKLEIDDNVDTNDVTSQKDAKVGGRTFGVPVYATLVMKDKKTGKVLEERRQKLATLPKITSRYSYIVDGSEYQVDNQWRLKPGVYTKIKANGELDSFFNIKGVPMHVGFDPGTKKFHVEHGGAKPPLYPILMAMGVSEERLKEQWGPDILAANKVDAKGKPIKVDKVIMDFSARVAPNAPVKDRAEAIDAIRNSLQQMKLHPDVTTRTLGKPIDHINGDAFLRSSNRLLGVSRGTEKPDVRDSLMFKEFLGVEDFMGERIEQTKKVIDRRVGNNIDRPGKTIRDIVGLDVFQRPVREFFTKVSLASTPEQTNPLKMISGQMRTTIAGEGGVQDASRITEDAKLVDPSHFTVLDPLHTPECHDHQTEVFTRRGWVPWPDVNDRDEFACNVEGTLEFHHAERIVREKYKGVMYGAETKYLSYLVTPNHRMWCRSRDGRSPKQSQWHFEFAAEMSAKTRNVFTVHEPYLGADSSGEFHLPHVEGNNSSKNYDSVPMDVWASFLGWYLSEGSFTYDEEKSRYFTRIHQSRSANPDNCDEIAWVLDQLPFKWTYADRSFIIGVKQLAHYVSQFGKAQDKFIPEYMFDASFSDREELLAALLQGDGRLNARRTNGDLFHDIDVFTTTSARLADGVERLIISLGYASTRGVYEDRREERYLDVHEVRILRRKERVVRKGLDHVVQEYDGVVYCATVPGGLLYTRRHGKTPFWSGNSDKTGVNLQLSLGATKRGREVMVPVVNVRTGRSEYITPAQINDNVIALPDAMKRVGSKWVPASGKMVRASVQGNEIQDVPISDVKYVVPKSAQMFSIATNMVPFISSDSPNRATMAGRHQEQAIPLVDPEPPLVQSMLGQKSFDEIVGEFAAHRTPTGGTVTKVTPDHIVIKGKNGKESKVSIYNNYPTNDKKGMIHSTPVVKVGDAVKPNDLIADTNFSKGGVYAPGKNLNVAYMPWKGYNFEDGVVISESAAQKLASQHLYKKGLSTHEAQLMGKDKYVAHYPDRLNRNQMDMLDQDGVIKAGTIVKAGDTLIAALSPRVLTTEEQKLRMIHKSIVSPFKDKAVTWGEDYAGEVVEVFKRGNKVDVHIKTTEPMDVGDKMVGRHGNKGIVTKILPDTEMPTTKEGKSIEVIMNPIGTPGRMNIGQVLETAASKVAEKTGKTFKVHNFEIEDNLTHVEQALKQHGLSDKEDVIDPVTGRTIPGIQVGKQYILKMEHQVGKKMAARDRDAYDHNLVPMGGGPKGGQALGSLGLYAMLAHGAKANIREMWTYKSDKAQGGQNDDLWKSLQSGELLPPPKSPFVYNKLISYMKGMGVDVHQDGNSLNLVPLTDKHVLEMSNGELKDAGKVIRSKDLKPERGGLFDEKITGGLDGTKWSHIKLGQPMPNPIFERAIMSVARIRAPQYDRLIAGEEGVMPDGTIVGPNKKGATYGPQSVTNLLKGVDVQKDLATETGRIKNVSGQLQSEVRKRIKFLRALDKLNMKPEEAYVIKHVPVLPPSMRPLGVLDDGSIQNDDMNQLYKQLAVDNNKLKEMPHFAPHSVIAPVAADVYDHVKALTGMGGTLNQKHPGILDMIAGRDGPKTGFAQDVLIKRKMDLTARSTIVPEPSLGLDEVMVPRKAAKEMYKPFIVRELKHIASAGPLEAKKMIEQDDPLARIALERVVKNRPLWLKRDPVLHKYGVQAFNVKLTDGKAIKIHPLVCSGFNADFDGDTMSATPPITEEAIEEARRSFPSRNLFSPATATVMYAPSHEAQVGLFMLAQHGKETKLSFKSAAEAEAAQHKGQIGMNDVIRVGSVKTTAGRAILDARLPPQMRGGKLLTDMKYKLTKGDQSKLFEAMARADPGTYPDRINKIKDLGNEHVTYGGFSFGLEDFKTHRDIRDPILAKAQKATAHLDLTKKQNVEKFVDEYERAMVDMEKKLKDRVEATTRTSSLSKLEVAAGIKGKGYRQLTAAPLLFTDAKGEVVTTPVNRSYAEGLSTTDYWAATSGGRKGAVQRVQSVREPGYLTKMMVNATVNNLISDTDCGSSRGISLSTDEPDILGRYTATQVKVGRTTIPTNTLMTPDILDKIRNAKMSKVVVRSPMRCNHPKGTCQHCFGTDETGRLPDMGTNVGVIATQSLGERGTQLAMKAFHSGGVYEGREASAKSIAAGGLDRATSLLYLPKKVRGSATLAREGGAVTRIEKDPAGGQNIWVGSVKNYVPAGLGLKVRVGSQIKRGDPISSGPINVHEMLPLTKLSKVQGHLANELHDIYGQYGIRRRHSETIVRAMTNVTKVKDPGGHSTFLPGDFAPTSEVYEWNRVNKGATPISHVPVVKGVKQVPLDVQTDWLARLNHEQLKGTLIDAAQQGWSSSLHGSHPIPALIHGAEFGKGTKEQPWSY